MDDIIKFSPEELQEAASAIRALQEKYPLLNPSGWASPWFYVDEHHSLESVLADREAMPQEHAEPFLLACEWIRENMPQSRKVCRRKSSYGLKDIAEKEIGYIQNGTFIAAAIHCGLKFVPVDKKLNSQNVFFKFDDKPFKKKYRKYF